MFPHYQFVITADGSPTFQDQRGANLETMHHRGGAYSETQYIYGRLVRECFDRGLASFVSVGLGLGYNEFLIAAEALQRGFKGDLHLRSFEADPFLRSEFLAFIQGTPVAAMTQVYEQILEFFCKDSRYPALSGDAIKKLLNQLYIENKFLLEGALDLSVKWPQKFSGILFDAYSSKTNPELWSEEFLFDLFKDCAAGHAIFSTYACTGALKRSLRASQFQVEKNPGFGGRKDCTYATRGL